MRIGLGKEYRSMGCEWISRFMPEFIYQPPSFDQCRELYICDDGTKYEILEGEGGSLYRDFLQLIIEAINKAYRTVRAYPYSIDQTRYDLTVGYDSKTVYKKVKKYNYATHTEIMAKEKAIAYVLDKMEKISND